MNQPWAATLKCLTFCLCKVPTCASTVFTFVQIFLSKNFFLPNSPHSFMDAEAVTRTNKSWCSGWYRGWCKLDHEPKYCHCIIECTREDTVKSLFLYVSGCDTLYQWWKQLLELSGCNTRVKSMYSVNKNQVCLDLFSAIDDAIAQSSKSNKS